MVANVNYSKQNPLEVMRPFDKETGHHYFYMTEFNQRYRIPQKSTIVPGPSLASSIMKIKQAGDILCIGLASMGSNASWNNQGPLYASFAEQVFVMLNRGACISTSISKTFF